MPPLHYHMYYCISPMEDTRAHPLFSCISMYSLQDQTRHATHDKLYSWSYENHSTLPFHRKLYRGTTMNRVIVSYELYLIRMSTPFHEIISSSHVSTAPDTKKISLLVYNKINRKQENF